MHNFDPHEYSVSISRESIDGESLFRATVKELPDVLALGQTYGEAYEMAVEAISELYEASREDGRGFPAPARSDEGHSGRFTLRMERSLHRAAAALAEREGTSLNNLITSALAVRVALGTPMRCPTQEIVNIQTAPSQVTSDWFLSKCERYTADFLRGSTTIVKIGPQPTATPTVPQDSLYSSLAWTLTEKSKSRGF